MPLPGKLLEKWLQWPTRLKGRASAWQAERWGFSLGAETRESPRETKLFAFLHRVFGFSQTQSHPVAGNRNNLFVSLWHTKAMHPLALALMESDAWARWSCHRAEMEELDLCHDTQPDPASPAAVRLAATIWNGHIENLRCRGLLHHTFAAEFFGSPFPLRLLEKDREWDDRLLRLALAPTGNGRLFGAE